MFFAILIVPSIAIQSLGGLGETAAQVGVINAEFNNIFADTSFWGIIFLMAWGLGYFGQPHILARFMALRSPKDAPTAQVIGMFWVVLAIFWRRMTRNGAAAGIVAGALTVIVWKQLQGGVFDIYEIASGFILGLIAVIIVSLMDTKPSIEISQEFAQVREQMTSLS